MLNRTNMLSRQADLWRPLSFQPSPSGIQRVVFAARRFLDLQTASIWVDLASLLPGVTGVVVDVGCGAQPYRILFSSEVTYIGIDTVDAKTRFGYEVPDTRYYSGTCWPVADSSVDFVLCTETLEHVPDSEVFLDEAARCLAPGGRLLLTVPFAARWHYIPHDYWRFTPSSLQRLLTDAGFTNVAVYARGNELSVACYKVMALMLPLLYPQGRPAIVRLFLWLAGLALSPLFGLLAVIGHLSLKGNGGDDCLGYTVVAER
jgi:SAM-dependent methyltransferase